MTTRTEPRRRSVEKRSRRRIVVDETADQPRGGRRPPLGGLLGSTSCHAVLLLMLAAWPLGAVSPPGSGQWTIDGTLAEDESLPIDVTVLEESIDEVATEPETGPAEVVAAVDLPELDLPEPSDLGNLPVPPALDTSSGPTEPTPPQESTKPPARPPSVSFLGSETEARSIVFLVDASSSMRGAKFQRAIVALQKSLRELERDQTYLVVLFREDAVVLFDPEPATNLLPPTSANRTRTTRWLRDQRPEGLTDPRPGLELALALKPDTIFLLADGELPATVLPLAATAKRNDTRIHTLTFDTTRTRVLETLAKSTGGTHRVAQ